MITYVINTSESRTLNNNTLFELSGYNKIKWMNCRLSDVKQCAQHIYEQQNVLGADKFRIAVLIDFFGFDRIRVPFGRVNYLYDEGIDVSLYLPYIEVFLVDNLIKYLEHKELYTSDFEIYYVQSTKLDQYEFIHNAPQQLVQILKGCQDTATLPPVTVEENEEDKEQDKNKKKPALKKDTDSKKKEKEENETVVLPKDPPSEPDEAAKVFTDNTLFSAFELYCTKSISLRFDLNEYPYGADKMTLLDFYRAFNSRAGIKHDIRRHYYISNFGSGKAHVAFDTLSLSLYLIRMYEREEMLSKDESLEIAHIDPMVLKEVLENAWIKINVACELAKNNTTSYYSLAENVHVDIDGLKQSDNKAESYYDLYKNQAKKFSAEQLYEMVCNYHNRTPEQVAEDNREEFKVIMADYLKQRDETREVDVENELKEKMEDDLLSTTSQFPSKEEFIHLVSVKEDEISKRFEKALSAEYIDVDYSEEKKEADKAYDKYCQLKACMHKNIVGDIIFMIVALLAFLVPYGILQLTGYSLAAFDIVMLLLHTAALFGAIFILAVIIQMITLGSRMAKAKAQLRVCYQDCYVKDRYSMSQIRNRYKEDLLYIERSRYEIRQLKYLYQANLLKEANVKRHREMLKTVNSQLSSILNSLDVKPVLDPNETVAGEFDITKPIRSRENKVYRIFSIDTIERLFNSKGGDR